MLIPVDSSVVDTSQCTCIITGGEGTRIEIGVRQGTNNVCLDILHTLRSSIESVH